MASYTVPPMGYPRYELPDVAPAPAPGYGLPAPGYALPEVAPAPVPGKCRPRTIVTTSVLAIKQPPVETTLTKLYKEVHTIKSFYVTPVTVAKTYSVLPSVLTTASYQVSYYCNSELQVTATHVAHVAKCKELKRKPNHGETLYR